VFCVVTGVHKFDVRLVTNETPNTGRPEEGRSCNDKRHVFDAMFAPDHRRGC
jgi:hypothetical protein